MKKTILVMDDEDMVGEIACQMLEFLGFDSERVMDGEEAIASYRKRLKAKAPFDGVIMDLTIPGGMGGKEAVGKILALNSSAKVFVSSGDSTDPVMSDCTSFGFCGVIAKPFDLSSIKEVLAPLLDDSGEG